MNTYTREEIVAEAQAALANWDLELANDPEQCKRNLEDIIDGSDDIGTDEPVETTKKLIYWLQDYVDPYVMAIGDDENLEFEFPTN
jgi:hypothetical protein